jgi:hypothetical protein
MSRILAAILVATIGAAQGRSPDTRVRVQSINGPERIDPFVAPAGVTTIVFVFTSTDCPISNRYAPEIKRIASEFGPSGVVVRLIYPNPTDQSATIREHMAAFGYSGAAQAFRDPDHALVKFVGATVTPEAAVYTSSARLVYRGRIDDRYVDIGIERPSPTRRDLAEAIAAAVAGRRIAQPTTQAVGCFISDFAR